jgi:hypothetical protein
MKILECVRKGGITYLTVDGNVSEKDVNHEVKIDGVSDLSVNGSHKVLSVGPGTIRISQPALMDIPAGIKGGTLFFATAPAAPAAVPAASKAPAKKVFWATPAAK